MNGNVIDALDGLSARDLEQLKDLIEKRLHRCIICNQDGAIVVVAIAKLRRAKSRFTLLLCPHCIEKHRLPEGRASYLLLPHKDIDELSEPQVG